jgi:hypothetical protein
VTITGRSATVLRRLVVVALVAVAIAPLAVAGTTDDASAAASASTSVTVSGSGPFASVQLTVDQTSDLVNQTVNVSWTGAPPTKATASGTVLGNFMQLMQCWAKPGQQPTREQCQFGGFVAVANGGQNVASRQITQSEIDPNETVYVRNPGDLALKYVNFEAIDGTVETERRSQFFDGSTTNEIPVARTGSDGKGTQLFEMQTGLEAPGLGCGQTINDITPDCFIVVVPRGLTEVTGRTVGENVSDTLNSSPLSQTNWNNRIVVPLAFRTVGGACSFGRPETATTGSDFVTEAITSWQPVLCGGGPRNYGFTSVPDETTEGILRSDSPGLGFVTKSVSGLSGAVYAPVTVSAMAFAADIERTVPIRDPSGKPISPDQVPADILATIGTRFENIKLTPRLLAKLLTQSYRFDAIYGTAKNLSKNPLDLSTDPEFLALNPAFKPQGYTMLIGNAVGRMFVTAGLSQNADLIWQYILSDADARSFLAGKPDPNGIVLNEKYKGLILPTNSFPRADLGCLIPSNAPTGFDLPNCTLDVYPFANSFASAARQLSRGEANRRDVPRLAQVNSYGLSPNQLLGERSLMGLTDTASSARYDQINIALRNKAGSFVTPTNASMAAAVASMTKDANGVLQPNVTPTSKDAYPLTVVTYAATVPGKLTSNQRSDYARLLNYAASEGQVPGTTAGSLPDGYLPLPSTLVAQTNVAAAKIANYVAPKPTSTPTPTPTPTPTVSSTPQPTPSDTTAVVPSTGDPTPTPTPTPTVSAGPTATPTTTPVASVSRTPADPVTATSIAVGAALILGIAALLLRVVLPWVAPRPPG